MEGEPREKTEEGKRRQRGREGRNQQLVSRVNDADGQGRKGRRQNRGCEQGPGPDPLITALMRVMTWGQRPHGCRVT